MGEYAGAPRGRRWWIGVTIVGFIIAVLFAANGPLGGFWGGTGAEEDIPAGALAGLITAGLVEAVAFGFGLAWLAFGWSVVRNVSRPLAGATYLAVGWALVSWAPHTSFHQSWTEDDWYGLVGIELGFHVTVVISAFIVAAYVWRTMRDGSTGQAEQPSQHHRSRSEVAIMIGES